MCNDVKHSIPAVPTARLRALGAALLLLGMPAWALAAAGQAIFVLGSASVINDGGEHVLKKGDDVDTGDIVVTNAKAHVQLRMDDGGLIAVRPDSHFRIDEFHHSGDKAVDKSNFSLLKGGFRSVTGAIGQANKKAYSVKTPVATIGIRGTDYTARLCDADCAGLAGDGLYLGVFSGGVVLSNDAGSIDVAPNEYGYVGGSAAQPQLLPELPSTLLFVQNDTAVQPRTKTAVATTVDSATVMTASSIATSTQGIDQAGNRVTLTYVEPVVQSPAVVVTTPVAERVVGFGLSALPGYTSMTGSTLQATSDVTASGTDLSGFNATLANGATTAGVLTVDTATATASDGGSNALTGISWGRWSGGTASVSDSTGTTLTTVDLSTQSLHWIAGAETTQALALPLTGTATYNFAGGTRPTDNAGNVGAVNTMTLGVDFLNQNVSANVSVVVGGNQWDAQASSATLNSNGSFGAAFDTVSLSSATLTSPSNLQGQFNGALVGPADATTQAPIGATLSYQMSGDAMDMNAGLATVTTSVAGVGALTLQ